VAMLTAMLIPAVARGDADPASDVLLGESVFYPYMPTVAPSLQRTLNGETAAAAKAHFPLKVALIGTPVDLGAIPILFGKPQKYAEFLDTEISFQTKQPVLVVMPAGYGIQGVSQRVTAAAASLKKPGSGSDGLAQAAIAAVAKLAVADGHPLADVPGASGAGASGNSSTLIIIVVAAVAVASAAGLVAVRRRRATAG
jgi:hypothetical protein